MSNTIYKAVFIILMVTATLYGLLSISLFYINSPNRIETNYEIAFDCSIGNIAIHYPKTVPLNFKETLTNEIESCNALIMGVRTVVVNFLKKEKYIHNITPSQKENIEQIIKQELKDFVTEVSAKYDEEFFPLFKKIELTPKEQITYENILNINQRTNILLQKISKYLEIKDA